MTTYTQQAFSAVDINNKPLAYGRVFLYRSRTSIPVFTYAWDGSAFVENPFPYILDQNGVASNLYLADTPIGTITMNLTDAQGVQQVVYPVNDITTGLLVTIHNTI